MEKLKTFMFLLITVLAACGCRSAEEKITPPWEKQGIDKETFFVQYMEKRYGEKFIFLQDRPDYNNEKFDVVFLNAERYPETNIRANFDMTTGELWDSYMPLYMRDDVEQELSFLAKDVYLKYKIFYTEFLATNLQNPDMTLAEYLRSESSMMGIPFVIFVEDEKYLENRCSDMEKFRASLQGKRYAGNILLYYLQPGKLAFIDRKTWSEVFNGRHAAEWHVAQGDFSMDSETFEFDYKEWRETK